MSAINATASGLHQFFQTISGDTQSAAADGSAAAVQSDPASTTTQAAPAAGRYHHHHGGQAFGQIQSAVTTALQSAQANGSADPNQIIQDAIEKVLQGGAGSQSAGTAEQAATSDADGDANAAPTSQAGTTDTNSQTFFQMLQSLGVDPAQFHKDFLAAVQAAQGGQVDPGTAFQSFPPGVAVDTNG